MREFGMGFDAVLALPIKRFWFLVNQIDRLRAEENIRHLHVAAAVASDDGESLKMISENLSEEIGKVFVWQETPPETEIRIDPVTGLDPEFDRDGLRSLKNIGTIR